MILEPECDYCGAELDPELDECPECGVEDPYNGEPVADYDECPVCHEVLSEDGRCLWCEEGIA